MSRFRAIILTAALAMAAAAPAQAGMNGTESIDRMQSARRSQVSVQAAPVGTEWWSSGVSARKPTAKPNDHRYRGGPGSLH